MQHQQDKEHILLKLELKFLVVEENLGDKKELVMPDKEVSEQFNGEKVELPLDQNQETILRNKIKKLED